MIKKRTLLTTLVLLSIMQGSVYAAPINFISNANNKYFKFETTDDGYKIIDKITNREFYTTRDDDKNLNIEIDVNYNPSDKNQEVFFGLLPFQQPGDGSGEESIKLYTFNFNEDVTFGPLNEYANWGSVDVSYDKHAVFNLASDKTLEAIYTPGQPNVAGAFKIDDESTLTINGGNIIARMVGDYVTDYDQYAVYLNVNAIVGAGGTPSSYSGKFVVDANSFDIISDLTSVSDYIQALYNNEGYINFELNNFKITNSENGQRFTQGLVLVGSSLTDINADNVLINATNAISVQDKNTELNISGETVNILGSIGSYSGSSINFNKNNEYTTQQVNVIVNGEDAILGQPKDAPDSLTGKTDINFNTDTLISAQGTDFSYHNNPEKRTAAAIRANRFSEVNLNDDNSHYEVYGDIIAARGNGSDDIGGKVNVGGVGSVIKGDILAANTGSITINLKNNGVYEGRVDDYADATLEDVVFRPEEFDVAVTDGGTVNMTLNNSTWTAHGQSFVTSVDFGQEGGVIDLSKDENNSVTIRNLTGNGTFNMLLNSEDHSVSDMLYIGKNEGIQTINIVGGITGGLENISEDNPLRFATVGIDTVDDLPSVENSGISAYTRGAGLYNLEYFVDKEKYNEQDGNNEQYNGSGDGQGVDKPGNDFVEDALVADSQGQAVNWIITGAQATGMTDSGETIVNMSHANYKNAVYMDRLNKRLGEARYIDGDEGMWVRLRHDRIGQQGEFRSMNTMYQLGYDKLDNKDDKGERHIGAAIDYMDGSTSYSDIYGEGETKRWGFWMYDTWLGNKGHYADYIVKFGHLHNDFDLRDKDSGEKVTGDYDNNVFSISAEYGRKKDIGNDWYIEPQAQLQLARVTDAEYTTSQGTDVYVDGINSLIGRIGFRLGKDVDERSTVYVKADVLHEFLGDQRIVAGDVTGALDKTYENSGTWYDVGFGFATAVGNNSYAYLDFEKSFGNDNDETYQINAGLQWSF